MGGRHGFRVSHLTAFLLCPGETDGDSSTTVDAHGRRTAPSEAAAAAAAGRCEWAESAFTERDGLRTRWETMSLLHLLCQHASHGPLLLILFPATTAPATTPDLDPNRTFHP